MPQPEFTVADILCTEALSARPERSRDLRAENDALRRLMLTTVQIDDPLPALLSAAIDVCGAGSAGISLLEVADNGSSQFRWVALAGQFASYVGGTTPGDFSPCGTTLSLGSAQLFSYPARFFTYFAAASPDIVEGLVLPFIIGDQAGTIWIVSHDTEHHFTAGDAEFMTALAEFSATVLALRRSERVEREARIAAESADRLKDDFLATVCHELRTPLNSIVGWSELLAEPDIRDGLADEAVGALRDAAIRQSRLVDDLLDMSRLASGGLQLEYALIDLQQVVRGIVEAVRPVAAPRRIRLDVDVPPQSVLIMGDAGRLRQALTNVITNAIKFTPPGGTVGIAMHRLGDDVQIRVDDSGVGIDPDFLPHVFDRFRREDSSMTRRVGGLGLGLAISRDIIDRHAGTIEAASPGRDEGSTFTVKLPCVVGHRAVGATTTGQASVEDMARLSGVRILFVDDDEDAREVIPVLLRQRGAEVLVANSAEEGFRLWQEWQPDLLLSDLAMPDEDGYQFMSRIRRSAGGTALLAAALSACATPSEQARALDAGFDVHVSKPVTGGQLVSAVAALLDERVSRQKDSISQ